MSASQRATLARLQALCAEQRRLIEMDAAYRALVARLRQDDSRKEAA